MNVFPIPAAQVPAVWPRVKDWLDRACRRSGGLEDIDGLRRACEEGDGHILCLLDDKGAVVFQRDADWLHVTSLGGTDILANIAELVDWWARIAGAVGCKGLSLRGRKGWDRVFKRFGFRRNGEYLEARL